MLPILYYLELSPPVRSVLLTAKAINLNLELKNVNLMNNEQFSSDYLKLNPQHTVPTLDDNGFILWDSHAINAYIIAKYANNDELYPKDIKKRAIVDNRLHFDSGILFPRLRNIFFPIIFLGKSSIPENLQEMMQEGYDFMEAFLEGQEFLACNQLTIADFSAVATLSSIMPVVTPRKRCPNISRWLERMEKLPYYEEANGNGAKALAELVNSKLKQ